ncbi:isopentenyl-diphosphate Delta-isomerase [Glycomyces buryatensis]|uniref:Isopentenyl-diphosphate Delta-isomerase n=1 Tax=Glycomyces buryatensis TaxID=2570927 RepID=A0A4S8PUR2_9ACTN|nr:isopentenyl-diphosphate Delta-isomerase [Glycomyces buryatensis]THV33635.1 isopentenyl-diphosphate Delta-isomerase [Glycomyces buryatensis]
MTDAVEEVVLLDDDGTPIGRAPKEAVHGGDTPLHLAFSCYGFDRAGRVLMTRRSGRKRVFPGIWTNTCCGHPGPGEFMETAIARRIGEELGVVPEDLVCALPTFRYQADMDGVLENEICPVYLCRIETDPSPNPDEVEGFEWIAWDAYKAQALRADSDMSPWTRMQVRQLDEWGLVQRYLA